MGCADGTVRYILFFFNFLLVLAGLGMVILGVVVARSEGATLNDVTQGHLTTPAIMFSIVGACVFIFAFFGCCGALRESHCMVCTYAVMLLTLFLLQVAVAVLIHVYKGQAEELITKALEESFEKYQSDESMRKWVDSTQQQFKCCGSTDSRTPWDTMGIPQPKSCRDPKNSELYTSGCIPTLKRITEDSLSNIFKVAIVIAIVQVVGIAFSLCLANSIRRSELQRYA